MSNLTESSFATSYFHQLPTTIQDLINQNRDILNFVLDGELQKEGPYSLKKIRSVYQGRGEALRNLEIEGFIDNSKYAGKTTLRFPGFFSCTSEDAKALHEMAKRIYRILFESYKNFEEERWFSSQDLVKAVWPLPDLPEYYRALNKILIYFNTAPIHVVTLQDNLGFDHPTSNVPIVRAGEQIIDFKDLEALILESSKKFSIAFQAKYSVVENYNIKEENFLWDGNLKDQKEYKCFVIMPIGDKESLDYKNNMSVYNQIIKKAVDSSGYKIICHHADDELFTKSGDISKQIFESLRDEDIVIADLRESNINVIYELGIRHTFGKRSILACSDYSENFFHNQNYRAIKYEITGKSNQEFYERMKSAIEEIIKNPEKLDNPVVDSLGKAFIDGNQEQPDVIIGDRKQLGSTGGGGGYRDIQCLLTFKIKNRSNINVALEDVEIKNEILGAGVLEKHNPNVSRLPLNVDPRKIEEFNLLFKFPNGAEGNMKGKDLKLQVDFKFFDTVINKEIIRQI